MEIKTESAGGNKVFRGTFEKVQEGITYNYDKALKKQGLILIKDDGDKQIELLTLIDS